jgi:hypothetical protein
MLQLLTARTVTQLSAIGDLTNLMSCVHCRSANLTILRHITFPGHALNKDKVPNKAKVTLEHAMKAHRESTRIAVLFL